MYKTLAVTALLTLGSTFTPNSSIAENSNIATEAAATSEPIPDQTTIQTTQESATQAAKSDSTDKQKPTANRKKKKTARKFTDYSDQCLKPHQLVYETRMYGMKVNSVRTLKKTGKYYTSATLAESWMADIHESSLFNYARNRVQPLKYSYELDAIRNKTNTTRFDWDNNLAYNTINGKNYQAEVQNWKLYQDKTSYQVQLCFELSKNINADNIEFRIPYKNRFKSSKWKNHGSEKLKTEVGTFEAVKLSKIRDHKERNTTIWLAKNHGFILLKLEQREDDDNYHLDITSAIIDGKRL